MKNKWYLKLKWFFDQKYSNLSYIQVILIFSFLFILISIFYILPESLKNYKAYNEINNKLNQVYSSRLDRKKSLIDSDSKDFYSDFLNLASVQNINLINFKEISKTEYIEYNITFNGAWLDNRKFIEIFLENFKIYQILAIRIERNKENNSVTTNLIVRKKQ